MLVGVLRIELLLYSPQNLKEKRGMVRKVLDRCRVRFPVSCAEVGMLDLWQRTQLGFSMVAAEEAPIHSVFCKIEEEIAKTGFADITDSNFEFFHY